MGIHIGHYDSIKLGIRLRGDIVETLKGWLNGWFIYILMKLSQV